VAEVAEFIAAVREQVPFNRVGLYCDRSHWLNTTVKAGDFLWLAAYVKEHGVVSPLLKFWQYTNTPIDANIGYFKTKAELVAWATIPVPPKPPVPPVVPPVQPPSVGVWAVDPAKVSTVLYGRDSSGKIANELSPGATIPDGVAFITNSVGRYALLTASGFSYDREYLVQVGPIPLARPFPTIPDYDVLERIRFRDRLVCRCVAVSLPWVEYRMLTEGLIKFNIDIYQGGYSTAVADSAGTHAAGGNTDSGQFTDPHLAVWRAMGWAMQRRTVAQGFTGAHGHGWPVGCPHLSGDGAAQAADWQLGRDGLRQHGLITGPEPKGKATPKWDLALAAYIKKVGAPASPN
jgi:hypothetical protein